MDKTKRLFSDTLTMSNRCVILSMRNPDTLLTSIIAPVLMMLLFGYIFGGAIDVGNMEYVNYIVPGILLQCIGQCASTTAISVSNDMKRGIVDRFCTMPVMRSSILTGHVLEGVIRNSVTMILVMMVAVIVGFRPSAGVGGWIAAVGLLLLYTAAITWISVFFGIIANGPEGAGTFVVFASVLPYLSSGFVPVETMPGFLRIFAENQPMTPIIESLRSLMLGESLKGNSLAAAIIWSLAILVVFYYLSARVFKNKIWR